MHIPIVFSTDHNYVMPTGVTICSLVKSNPDTVFSIYILISDNVTSEDKRLLTQQVAILNNENKIAFIEVGKTFNKSFEIRDISTACYYRLLIPWILPQYDKIIYSDVDIIFKKDISEIFNISLGKDYVGGVCTPGFQKKRTARYITKLGLNPRLYINSGFIIINSKLQRDDQLKDQYLQLSKKKFLFQDQDIINIVCEGRIKLLDQIYNVSPSAAIDNPNIKVLHYAGAKPWKAFTLKWIEWWDIYRTSIWFNPQFNDMVSKRILNKKEMIKDLWRDFKSKYLKR